MIEVGDKRCIRRKKLEKWPWFFFFSEYFSFPLSAQFHQCSRGIILAVDIFIQQIISVM